MTTYVATTTFGKFRFEADMVQAAAPIYSLPDTDSDDDLSGFSTPYQTADARHSEWKAALLLLDYFGRDYWLDPGAAIEEDDEGNETIDGMSKEKYLESLLVSVDAA